MDVLTIDNIKDEWNISQSILKGILGFAPRLASIPNGYASKTVIEGMLDAGIALVDTSAITTQIKHYKSATLRGRYAITEDTTVDNLLQLVSSPFYRFKKRVRYEILEIAKAILGNSYLTIRKRILGNK